MSTDAIRVQVASDGTRKMFRTGAGNEGPRPIDDKELEAVAAGVVAWVMTFDDGCEMQIEADHPEVAYTVALQLHANKGHTTNGGSLSALQTG